MTQAEENFEAAVADEPINDVVGWEHDFSARITTIEFEDGSRIAVSMESGDATILW